MKLVRMLAALLVPWGARAQSAEVVTEVAAQLGARLQSHARENALIVGAVDECPSMMNATQRARYCPPATSPDVLRTLASATATSVASALGEGRMHADWMRAMETLRAPGNPDLPIRPCTGEASRVFGYGVSRVVESEANTEWRLVALAKSVPVARGCLGDLSLVEFTLQRDPRTGRIVLSREQVSWHGTIEAR